MNAYYLRSKKRRERWFLGSGVSSGSAPWLRWEAPGGSAWGRSDFPGGWGGEMVVLQAERSGR